MTHIVSDSSSETLLCHGCISTKAVQASSHGLTQREPYVSLVCTLLDCFSEARVPSVLELLLLVDFENPAIRRKQIDVFSALVNSEVDNVVDIYSLPVDILVALSGLDKDEASRLHAYCQDKFLGPLLLLETRQLPRDDISVIEIPPPHLVLKQQRTSKCKVSKRIKLEKENVPPDVELQVAKCKLKDDEEVEEQLEGINHWIDGVESGEELEEDDEALMVANMSSYDADSESGGYPSSHEV
ncbi:hypothetical protein EI94DRAFT_1822868 [Lactarius quietus]|nr:hypothetical protein EI94DRAFT_1822868 [Lactarius quietus]